MLVQHYRNKHRCSIFPLNLRFLSVGSKLLAVLYTMSDLKPTKEPTRWGTATETSAARYSRTNAPQHGLGNSLSTMMKISKGQHVLVTACGPGTDVLAIAQLVGPSGKVVGFDLDKHSIDRAREALEKHPVLKPYVQLHVADVHDLSTFAEQTFDAIHCNASYHWFTNKPLSLRKPLPWRSPAPSLVSQLKTAISSHPCWTSGPRYWRNSVKIRRISYSIRIQWNCDAI